jgi:hypothetical protein
MNRDEKRWIVAGAYAIDADSVLYINTAARWYGAADGDEVRDAWDEVPPSRQVERTGVEVVFTWHRERPPLRFPDGSREADDLKAFVRSAVVPDPDKIGMSEIPTKRDTLG